MRLYPQGLISSRFVRPLLGGGSENRTPLKQLKIERNIHHASPGGRFPLTYLAEKYSKPQAEGSKKISVSNILTPHPSLINPLIHLTLDRYYVGARRSW